MKKRALDTGSIKTIIKYVFKYNRAIAYTSIALSIMETVASIAFPFLVGVAIDSFVSDGFDRGFITRIALMSLMTIISAVCGYTANYLNNVASQRVANRLRIELMEKLQKTS
ncbi:MAG: hypothetical protein LBE09_02130, partial [Christensenellaceae bacterium]|nr:hypothetical protein [Christensenellaceae bacterium]